MKMARTYLSLLFLTPLLMPRVLGSGSHSCEFGQYWQTVLETCIPCSNVCEPLRRPPCLQLCNDYFLSIVLPRTMDMLTSTTQPISHTQPISYTNASEKNLQLIVAVPFLLLMVIMAVVIPTVCIRYGKKDKNTRPKTYNTQSSEMTRLADFSEHNDNANDTAAKRADTMLNIEEVIANVGRSDTAAKREDTMLNIDEVIANVGSSEALPLIGQLNAGQPDRKNNHPKQRGYAPCDGEMSSENDGKFLSLRTPQTGPRCGSPNAIGNGEVASIDNDKTNWSTMAIYDKKNNCMKIEGMDKFLRETNL